MSALQQAQGEDFYVVCDNIRSAENIGSIFRTADALGIKKVYLCGICPVPPNPKISKTALGAEESVPFEHHKQTWRLVERLQKDGILVVALEQTAKSVDISKFKPNFPLALVIGHEVKGVSKKVLEQADAIVHLPMKGQKESLNVAVAFGVAGYQLSK